MRQTFMFQVFLFVLAFQLNVIKAEITTTYPTTSTLKTQTIFINQSDTTISTITKTNDSSASTNIDRQSSSVSFCEKRDKPYLLPHKTDRSKFYVCVKGRLFLLNCHKTYQFDNTTNQCVRRPVYAEIDEKLQKPTLIPHENNCGWYYVVRTNETTDERLLNSCPMPQLFDIPTLECKNYTEVKCNDRFEPKDACDYQIRSAAHAYPCTYLPSCKNRPDGLYPDRLRDCRMYFRCTSERSSESYSCSQDIFPMGERFSFEQQRCLPAQYVECLHDQKPLFKHA